MYISGKVSGVVGKVLEVAGKVLEVARKVLPITLKFEYLVHTRKGFNNQEKL